MEHVDHLTLFIAAVNLNIFLIPTPCQSGLKPGAKARFHTSFWGSYHNFWTTVDRHRDHALEPHTPSRRHASTMPHHITNCAFARTSLTTCDIFLMGLPYIHPIAMPSPEELIEAASPWFLDAETIWWRRSLMGVG
jgi:hypothetical protein